MTTAGTTMQYVTVTEIAAELNEPPGRVSYAAKSRGIEPFARAGLVRLFERSDIEPIRVALQEINQKRRGTVPAELPP